MKDFMNEAMGGTADKAALGNVISTWRYSPAKSNKFLFAAIAVIGGLVISLIFYFENLIPFLKDVPAYLLYAIIFLLGPLLKYFTGKSKDQVWTLYENGYSVVYESSGGSGAEAIGFWRDFVTSTYDSNGVKLISRKPFRRPVKIPTNGNVTEIYSIVRERISIAQAFRLEGAVKLPARPKTREQRKIQRAEMRTQREHQADMDNWKHMSGPPAHTHGGNHSGMG